MITIKDLCKTCHGKDGDAVILNGVNVDIENGEIISVIGPSDASKSMLLRCINRLERPDSGEIWIDGENILASNKNAAAIRRKVGMVEKSPNLFLHLSIVENVMKAPMDLLGATSEAAYEQAMELLGRVGMKEYAKNHPCELSDGQQQRVAIARALAMQPKILLLDQPTAALDPSMAGEVISVIKGLAQQGITMIIATDEMKLARNVCTRVLYMDEGMIYEDGAPEQIFDSPQDERTIAFINNKQYYSFEIHSCDFDSVQLVNELDAFAKNAFMPREQLMHLQLVVKELLFDCIAPRYNAERQLVGSVLVGYSENLNEAELKIEYGGEQFNPLESEDVETPLAITNQYAEAVYDNTFSINRLTLKIKA